MYACIRNVQLSAKILLLSVQLQLYRDTLRREKKRLKIPEWARRVFVWTFRFAQWFGWRDWIDLLWIVTPATVIDWHRRRYTDFWTCVCAAVKRAGRPEIPLEVQCTIARLARENPLWLPERIQGEVWKLHGVRVHRQTVRKYMPPRPRNPEKGLRWKQFLAANLPDIAAMDFFVIPRLWRTPLIGFFVIAHDRRRLLHINVTAHPTVAWMKEQLLLALSGESVRLLLSDNDRLFVPVTQYIEETLLVRRVRTQLASPWQNGIAERFVRTLRQELLNYLVPLFSFSESVIRWRLLEYKNYYNEDRTHSANGLDSPLGRETPDAPRFGKLVAIPCVGGLHHRYAFTEVRAA